MYMLHDCDARKSAGRDVLAHVLAFFACRPIKFTQSQNILQAYTNTCVYVDMNRRECGQGDWR